MDNKFIVFEGPDNIGKTTLCNKVSEILTQKNKTCEVHSFPGNQKGTLGKFVHNFHHNHQKYGVTNIPNISLQLFHVAAHFDTIEKNIKPAIANNEYLLLDRYWWSTYVYGKVNNIKQSLLDKLLEIEKLAWKELLPDTIVLLTNDSPFEGAASEEWLQLRKEYLKIAENSTTPEVIQFSNVGDIEDNAQKLIKLF